MIKDDEQHMHRYFHCRSNYPLPDGNWGHFALAKEIRADFLEYSRYMPTNDVRNAPASSTSLYVYQNRGVGIHELAPRAVILYTCLDVLTEGLVNPVCECPVSDDFSSSTCK